MKLVMLRESVLWGYSWAGSVCILDQQVGQGFHEALHGLNVHLEELATDKLVGELFRPSMGGLYSRMNLSMG